MSAVSKNRHRSGLCDDCSRPQADLRGTHSPHDKVLGSSARDVAAWMRPTLRDAGPDRVCSPANFAAKRAQRKSSSAS